MDVLHWTRTIHKSALYGSKMYGIYVESYLLWIISRLHCGAELEYVYLEQELTKA